MEKKAPPLRESGGADVGAQSGRDIPVAGKSARPTVGVPPERKPETAVTRLPGAARPPWRPARESIPRLRAVDGGAQCRPRDGTGRSTYFFGACLVGAALAAALVAGFAPPLAARRRRPVRR